MQLNGICALITGGASGLGLASATALIGRGARVLILDLPHSEGAAIARSLGPGALFAPADIRIEAEVEAALEAAAQLGPVRALVHCAGQGGAVRILEKDGTPGSLSRFAEVITTNLVGTFNVLRLAAAAMARGEAQDGERGAIVLTSSVAAFEGQIGQIPYASSKAGIAGMTIVAARDLASRGIRVNTIAPGIFDTPLLARLPDDVKASLGRTVPFPPRLGTPAEFADLALHMLENAYLNGETVRLDGAIRMQPR